MQTLYVDELGRQGGIKVPNSMAWLTLPRGRAVSRLSPALHRAQQGGAR